MSSTPDNHHQGGKWLRPRRMPAGSISGRLAVLLAALSMAAGAARAYTVTDFAVDAAHACLGDPHEVACPNFNNFHLTIYGSFNTNKCYRVTIKRSGGAPCGSANSSGTDTCVVYSDRLECEIHATANSNFKSADNWKIEINERHAGCSSGSNVQLFPDSPGEPYLRIRGCNDSCFLHDSAIVATPNPAGCGDKVQVCATAQGSGNFQYNWDLNGNGTCGVCSGGSNANNPCVDNTDCPGGTCYGGAGFGDLITYTGDPGCPVDAPCCVTLTANGPLTVGVRVRDLGTMGVCTDQCQTVVIAFDGQSCDDGKFCNGAETCSGGSCVAGTPPNCNDGIACTTDFCDETNDVCKHVPNNSACSDGLFCNGAETCNLILGCQPGTPVNCADGVSCTVDTCNESTDSCVHTPNNASCSDGLFCNGSEVCHPVLGCQAGTPPNCSDAFSCTSDSCDESNDTCKHKPVNSVCNDGQYCNGVETCSVTQGCIAGTPVNCSDGIACTTDACNEATDSCTHTPVNSACSDGLYCNGAEVCHPTLGCQSGSAPDCTDGVACTTDACDEATDSCTHTPVNSACSDGLYCNGAEVCHPTLGCQSGTVPNCSDSIPCTTDACDEATDSCTHTPVHSACSDGQFCNGDETCSAIQGCLAGTPPNCNDGVSCTTDSCNETTDACDHVPQNSFCDDGLFCNGGEVCHPTLGCQSGSAPNCADGVACTVDACDEGTDSCTHTPNHAACDDGLFCNGAESCHAVNGCQGGTPPNCDDGVACTNDSCDETNDGCAHAPNHANCNDNLFCNGQEFCDPVLGCQDATDPCTPPLQCDEVADTCVTCFTSAECDDGVFCNGAETCVGGSCQAGTPPSCDDGIACTADSCNPGTDSCAHAPIHATCSDGAFCNGEEICDTAQGCLPGTAPNCDDGIACTMDSCNESADSCAHATNDAACGDGLYCNGAEVCHAVLGCQPGTAPNCSDGVPCTVDSCNEATDSCDHAPNHAACSDGQFCDGAEICDPVNGCVEGPPVDCADGVPCTLDSCNESTDSCDHVPSNPLCSDGLFCNGAEVCHPTGGCQAGTPPNCDDGVACTLDACNETTDSCDHTASHAACDDGQFCNGSELCDPVNGCQSGMPPNCDDGVACTVDTCDEAGDDCDHVPNHSSCGNGLFCDGSEFCDPILGCQDGGDPCSPPLFCDEASDSCVECLTAAHCDDGLHCNGAEACVNFTCQPGTPPNCSDGIACTMDACDEASDLCTHTPSDAACDNGLFCDGSEICNAVSGCQPGAPVNCDDAVPCTIDACDEATDLCTHTPDDAFCNNGFFCDGQEFCDLLLGCQDNSDPCSAPLFCDESTDQCVFCLTHAQCNDGLFCTGMELCVNGTCQPGTPPACDDGVACTSDFCNSSTDACDHAPMHSACDDGQYCNGSETCDVQSGCQSGTPVNCNDGVACTADACDEATDSCTHSPDNGACQDGLYCNGAEICDALLGCQGGTPVNCADSVACTLDACDEATDSCTHTPQDSVCNDNVFCDGVETCHPTLGCQEGTPPDCTDGVACTIDTCDPGADACAHAPDNAACSDGQHCNGAEVCSATFGCQPGTPPNCSDGIDCTADSCNEATDSCDHVPQDAPCSDGLYCNGSEVCDPLQGCVAGTPPNCSDGVSCTTDSCNENTDSCDRVPNHAACDDGQFCTGTEICDAVQGCLDGPDPDCSDGVGCTMDLCNESTDSCNHVPNSALCDDGQHCNGVEVCTLQGCQAGTPPNCDDAVSCTIDSCNEITDSCDHAPNHASCNDFAFCNGQEFCDPLLGCQDATDPCAPPTKCDEAGDRCVECLTDLQCDDGLFCNGVETCVDGSCQPGTPLGCDDAVACTIDFCNPASDTCEHTANHTACSDGQFCNGAEICDVLGGCQPGTPPDCSDAIACTVDACDEATDSCTHAPDHASCSDGAYCNGAEVCDLVMGCLPGMAPNCSDGVACTVDACDEATDSCTHAADSDSCDDGKYCNGAETCDLLRGCQPGAPPDCNDQVACTTDGCDESTDTCTHLPDHAACSDGLYCNGAEVCDLQQGCIAGAPPNCADAVSCTVDSCDEAADTCLHTPDNAACSNGLYCDGSETCDPIQGCQPGSPVVCADGVACTIDTCDEGNDRCVHNPNHVLCSDGQFCNGSEVCDKSAGCIAGAPPNCDDSVGCTNDVCDEASDACQHVPVDGLCDDGNFCNGSEICVQGIGCRPGAAVDCSDNIVCTLDVCNETTDKCVHSADPSACNDADPCTQDICMAESGCLHQPICGACCLPTMDCVDGVSETECVAELGGRFSGLGTLCVGDVNGNGLDDLCEVKEEIIPTVSEWGLAVLALLMLIGAKLRFRRSYNFS